MRPLRAWMIRIAGTLTGHRRQDRDFSDELDAHIHLHIEENIRAGMSPDDARRAARMELGGAASIADSVRDVRRSMWIDNALRDARYAIRMLRRSPGLTAVVTLTLSLTVGVGTSIFALIDAVVLTPPPFREPDNVLVLGEAAIDDRRATPRTVTYATFEAWRTRAETLAAIEAFDATNLTLTQLGAAERISATKAPLTSRRDFYNCLASAQ